MKVVQIINRFFPALGGAERHVYLLSKLLAEKGHDVTIYTTRSLTSDDIPQLTLEPPFVARKKTIQTLPREETIDGVVVKRFPVHFRFWSFLFVPEFTVALLHENADIFHVHGYQPFTSLDCAAVVKAKNFRKSIVLTTHDVEIAESLPHYAHGLLRFYDISFGRLLLEFSGKIIVINPDDTTRLVEMGAPRSKLVCLPNGIDTEFFDPDKVTSAEGGKFKQRFSLCQNVITFVGRLEKRKRIDLLVVAFKKVLERIRDCSLMIIGPDYGDFEFLCAFAKKLGVSDSIVFTDRLSEEELRVAYSVSNVVASMSEQEAFGLTLLEAMAMRIPVVAHAWKGMKYVVQDGKTGFLTDAGDPNDLASHIMTILTNGRVAKRMGKFGRAYVDETFNIRKIASQIEQLYARLKVENTQH